MTRRDGRGMRCGIHVADRDCYNKQQSVVMGKKEDGEYNPEINGLYV